MMRIFRRIAICALLFATCLPVLSPTVRAAPLYELTPSDLIGLINGMRVAYGLPALNVNAILMSTAQQTSDTMALNDIHWHIGNVSGRVMAAGYGGGSIAWATENFAIGPMTIERIQAVWADADHMIPVVGANYTDIGAGVTTYNGRTWYIVHAAYSSGSGSAPRATTVPGVSGTAVVPILSQIIIPVETSQPREDGSVIHEVQSGQALWSIAIAYETKVDELIRLNNLSSKDPIIYIGQKLVVFPSTVTQTPTVPAEAGSEAEPELTATATASITPSRTATRRPSATRQPVTPTATLTPTKENLIRSEGLRMLDDRNVGMVFIGLLALGILLMVTGSFSRLKK